MKKIHTILCLSIVAAITLPTILNAEDISQPPSPKVAVMLLADSLSAQMNIDPYQVKYVLKNESDYSGEAIGDHGAAKSVAQYHEDTFDHYESLYFAANGQHLNYNSATDQIRLMTWQWKVYPQSKLEWTTYRRLIGVKSKSTITK